MCKKIIVSRRMQTTHLSSLRLGHVSESDEEGQRSPSQTALELRNSLGKNLVSSEWVSANTWVNKLGAQVAVIHRSRNFRSP